MSISRAEGLIETSKHGHYCTDTFSRPTIFPYTPTVGHEISLEFLQYPCRLHVL